MRMSGEIIKKLDNMQATLSDVRISQGRTEEKLEAVVKLQEKHDVQLNSPNGKVYSLEKKVSKMEKEVSGVKVYLGLIVTAITTVVTVLINIVAGWIGGLSK